MEAISQVPTTPAQLVAWTRAVLDAAADTQASVLAHMQRIEALAAAQRSALDQHALLGADRFADKTALAEAADKAHADCKVALEALRLYAHQHLGIADVDSFEFTAHMVHLWSSNKLADLRCTLEFLHVTALRAEAGLRHLPITAQQWELASASTASGSAALTVGDARLVAAMKLWVRDRATTTTVYQPFHPVRRRIIALRHLQAAAADDDARLALFHERQQLHHAEVQQSLKVRMQNLDAIREHASLSYLQKSWRPTGGYLSPEDDDWEEQVERLKDMKKYKASKKGEGKRSKKKK